MAHQIVWCDIPVKDLDRAIRFYAAVLGAPVKKATLGEISLGLLPFGEGEVGACLYVADENKPSLSGPRIYLNVQGRLDAAVAAVAPNGGKVVEPKKSIAPHGFRAVVDDSEGNRIAFHSS
ncbi:MAG: VOC family protein [Nitrospirae bacterium]|nr:VOC family protein [Candidatus Manganitrophaceae bacterium]